MGQGTLLAMILPCHGWEFAFARLHGMPHPTSAIRRQLIPMGHHGMQACLRACKLFILLDHCPCPKSHIGSKAFQPRMSCHRL